MALLPKVSCIPGLFLVCFSLCRADNPAKPSPPPAALTPCCMMPGAKPPEPEPKHYLDMVSLDDGTKLKQKLTLKLVCSTADTACKTPPYPLVVGTPFNLQVSSDSGLPAQLALKSDSAMLAGSCCTSPYTYIPKNAGVLVFEANQPGNPQIAPARPVRLVLEVQQKADPMPAACAAFAIPSATEITRLDAPTVVTLLGNPKPFTLVAEGKDTIAIYSSVDKTDGLAEIKKRIDEVRVKSPEQLGIAPTPTPFNVEMLVPHASALGDLSSRIGALADPQLHFTVQKVAADKIRITAPSNPACGDWTKFLADLKRVVWQIHPEPMSAKLFYLNAPDVATALGGAPAASATTPATPSAGAAAAAATTPAATATSTPATSTPATTTAATTTVTVTGPAGNATSVVTAPSPTSVAPPASATASASATTPAAATPATPPAAPAAAATAPPPSVSVVPLGTDLLVFGDQNPGDDALITERHRILAALDIPRPEMIISAWVLQNSSQDAGDAGVFSAMSQRMVSQYNQSLQDGVLEAWRYLKGRMSQDNYFDLPFYSYITNRFVSDLKPAAGAQLDSQAVLENRSNTSFAHPDDLGACSDQQYCLGYTDLFNAIQPRLTDMLMAIIAANEPICEAENAANQLENPTAPTPPHCPGDTTEMKKDPPPQAPGKTGWKKNEMSRKLAIGVSQTGCEVQDLQAMDLTKHIVLNCFREVALQRLGATAGGPSEIGILRAAVADFLFHYKMSQQYPHEFSAYDLGRSADALNSTLRPFIDGFNQDVKAYQRYLGAEMETEIEEAHNNGWFKDKPQFTNNGLVTVRTISGQESTVDTISQSYVAGSAPLLSDVAKSMLGLPTGSSAGGGAASTGSGSGIGSLNGILSTQTQLFLGALSAFQDSKVQIGRELSIDVTPRSLNGASSAEILVTMQAGETAPPTVYGGSQNGGSADISRVATHNTSTRIRVDSIQIFDVSSFTAVVQKSRSRFPLLPVPGIEIPFIGSIIGIPLKPSTVYHSSLALMSALIVPTAADLASGLIFRKDLVVDDAGKESCVVPFDPATDASGPPRCAFRTALSLKDLDHQPILDYHRAMIHCLATGGTAMSWTVLGKPNECGNLSFNNVPHVDLQ